ncbi:MAG: YqjD family protein [Alphaproteobacteria bacterium]
MADSSTRAATQDSVRKTAASAGSGDEWDTLRSDFADLRKDVDRLLKALSAEQGERFTRLREKAGDAAMNARQAGVAAIDAAGKQFQQSQEALSKQIAGNPLASVGVAFAAGLMLAGLMRGRR